MGNIGAVGQSLKRENKRIMVWPAVAEGLMHAALVESAKPYHVTQFHVISGYGGVSAALRSLRLGGAIGIRPL
jgi:hypothetical protein